MLISTYIFLKQIGLTFHGHVLTRTTECLLLKTKHEFVFIYATKKAVLMGIWKRFEGARLLSPHVLCAGNTQRTCVIEIDQSEQGGLPVTHQNQSPSPPKTVAP